MTVVLNPVVEDITTALEVIKSSVVLKIHHRQSEAKSNLLPFSADFFYDVFLRKLLEVWELYCSYVREEKIINHLLYS